MSRCIVSVGVGGWYPQGIDRLARSLNYHGFNGEVMLWKTYPVGCPPHQENPYAFKLHAIQEAFDAGHDQVLWLDSSAWAIGNPAPVMDIIERQGHYLWTSGYWTGQWTNDETLEHFGVTREEAMTITMIYALAIGLDRRNDRSMEFFRQWKEASALGLFKGDWKRKEGDHPDYLGHRHDQSSASLIAHSLGMEIDGTHDLCHLYEPQMPLTVALTFRGI